MLISASQQSLLCAGPVNGMTSVIDSLSFLFTCQLVDVLRLIVPPCFWWAAFLAHRHSPLACNPISPLTCLRPIKASAGQVHLSLMFRSISAPLSVLIFLWTCPFVVDLLSEFDSSSSICSSISTPVDFVPRCLAGTPARPNIQSEGVNVIIQKKMGRSKTKDSNQEEA